MWDNKLKKKNNLGEGIHIAQKKTNNNIKKIKIHCYVALLKTITVF